MLRLSSTIEETDIAPANTPGSTLNPTEVTTAAEGTEGGLVLPTHTDSGYPVGEGSVEGTEGYAKRIKSYLRNADVEKDGTDAAPDSVAEASEMVDAETAAAGRSRAPGK